MTDEDATTVTTIRIKTWILRELKRRNLNISKLANYLFELYLKNKELRDGADISTLTTELVELNRKIDLLFDEKEKLIKKVEETKNELGNWIGKIITVNKILDELWQFVDNKKEEVKAKEEEKQTKDLKEQLKAEFKHYSKESIEALYKVNKARLRNLAEMLKNFAEKQNIDYTKALELFLEVFELNNEVAQSFKKLFDELCRLNVSSA